ncbi:MAG: sulfotransferase domain-containing protein [bacterium]
MSERPGGPWGRAKTLEEFFALHDRLMGKDSYPRGEPFVTRPSDVFITPFAKSGTTWLQQICHGLRSGGDMAFEEISYVVPCIDYASAMGLDLNADHAFEPRVYMTHATWEDAPAGGRYICAFRDPKAVIVSYYRFLEDWFFDPGAIDLAAFARAFMPAPGTLDDWWLHMVSWWAQRDNPSVLLLCYEEMVRDLPGTVRQIARLMQIEPTDELLEVVVRQSSRAFMLAHADRFDERGLRRLAARDAGLPLDSDASKVTEGADPDRYRLPPAIEAAFDALWRDQITPRTGLADYAALRGVLRARG